MLTQLGYKVLKASNGDSALEVIESGAQIDLLFTDVVMPGQIRSAELARRASLCTPPGSRAVHVRLYARRDLPPGQARSGRDAAQTSRTGATTSRARCAACWMHIGVSRRVGRHTKRQ